MKLSTTMSGARKALGIRATLANWRANIARARGWIDVMVVVRKFGMELIGLALQETVEAIEALLQRPVVMRAGCRGFLHRRQMPLASRIRRVTVRA